MLILFSSENKEPQIDRHCAYEDEADGPIFSGCRHEEQFGIQVTYCLCGEDWCNGAAFPAYTAGASATSPSTILSSVLGMMAFILLSYK